MNECRVTTKGMRQVQQGVVYKEMEMGDFLLNPEVTQGLNKLMIYIM